MPEKTRTTADNLSELKRGDRVSLEHHNAIVRSVKGRYLGADGVQDEAGLAWDVQSRFAPITFEISTTVEIPEFSIFSCKTDTAFADPVRLVAAKIGAAGFGSPLLFLTNGSIKIPANAKGIVRVVDLSQPTPIKITGTTPKVGNSCGVDLDAFGITGARYGLVCLAQPVTINTITNVALVVQTARPVSYIGVVSQEITAFNTGTNTFGKGKFKVKYRKTSDDTWETIKNPGDIANDWEHEVFQTGTAAIIVGETIHAVETTGIGLVVVKGSAGGTAPPIRTGITTSTLMTGSACLVAEINQNSAGALVYTGATHTVEDFKLNLGQSIPEDVKIDYCEYKDELGATHYKWLTAYCLITDTPPA